MVKKRSFGYIPDKRDDRDFIFKATLPTGELPESTDLRPKMSNVENQKTLGACVPTSIVGALEYYENVKGITFEDLSRLYLYWTTRVLQGTTRYDSGCEIRTCLKALARNGVCSEDKWKYDIRRYRTSPPQSCYEDGVRYKNVEYYRISTINNIISALSEGLPVIIGATLYPSFDQANKTGIVPMPKSSEYEDGGHCMLISGHDSNTEMFLVRNSWSSMWSRKMGGYCWMPYEYIGDRDLVSDKWVVKMKT